MVKGFNTHSLNIDQSLLKKWKKCSQQVCSSQTWTNLSTCGMPNSLCVCAKNRQISVYGKQYTNCMEKGQRMFAIPSTRMHIWYANQLQTVHKRFWFACVYQLLLLLLFPYHSIDYKQLLLQAAYGTASMDQFHQRLESWRW